MKLFIAGKEVHATDVEVTGIPQPLGLTDDILAAVQKPITWTADYLGPSGSPPVPPRKVRREGPEWRRWLTALKKRSIKHGR